jgi:L-lysine exporter family protein LysE/ArgO
MTAAITGFFTGISLIIAIGAQNAFVIRQGLARNNVLLVVAVCAISDAILIAAGVAGLGVAISGFPWLLEVVRWLGVGYLGWFGVRSIRAAFSTKSLELAGVSFSGVKGALLAVLGFTFLNPHVYIDTVLLLGSISAQFGDLRWAFGAGAMLGSVLWFALLGWGARSLSPLLRSPKPWRFIDLSIGLIMFTVALFLAFYSFD